MFKLCITGGPGAGRTVIINHLSQVLEQKGYSVFVVPNAATELLEHGIHTNDILNELAFQNFVLNKQLDNERIYEQLRHYYKNDKLIFIYDRGIADIGAFLGPGAFVGMLKKRQMSMADVHDRYDLVIHLVTAANGAINFYKWNDPSHPSSISNLALDNPDEALKKDEAIKKVWNEHPNRHIINTYLDFSDKMKEAIRIVFENIGEKHVPNGVKRFLINTPDFNNNSNFELLSQINIIQTYLQQHNENIDRRVVQRGNKNDGFVFYYVEKVDIGEKERFVTERQITKQEYAFYLSEANKSLHQLSIVRRGIKYNNAYCEIDTYDFDNNHSILTIDNSYDVNSISNLSIIKDITNDKEYTNKSLAQKKRFITFAPKNISSIQNQWIYETGREEKGLGKDDVRYYGVEITTNEQKAIKLFTERNRTYLIRYKKSTCGNSDYQWYDKHSKIWIAD